MFFFFFVFFLFFVCFPFVLFFLSFAQVLDLGATKAEVQPDPGFRVYLDPAGHPFCFVLAD